MGGTEAQISVPRLQGQEMVGWYLNPPFPASQPMVSQCIMGVEILVSPCERQPEKIDASVR